MAAGPRNPDGLLGDASWLALYNGLCLPLLAAVLVATLFPAARPVPTQAGRNLDGLTFTVSLGVCTAALLLAKAPHGVFALAAIAAGIALRTERRHLLLAGGALAGVLVCSLFIAFPNAAKAHLAQLVKTAKVSDPVVRLHMKKELVFGLGATLLGASFVAVWLLEQYRKEDASLWPDVGALLTATGLAWSAAFQDHSATPVMAVVPLLLAWSAATSHCLPIGGTAERFYRGAKATLLLLVPGLTLTWWTINGAASLPVAAVQARLTAPPGETAWRTPTAGACRRIRSECGPRQK